MSKVAISGYYGFNNAGDETVLYAIIQTLKTIEPGIEITVLSNEPDRTEKLYGVHAVNRWKLFEILSTLAHCDMLISGGGSLLQDRTSFKSPLYYLGVIFLAKFIGRPVVIYAQGIGPLTNKWNKRFTSYLLNKVHAITVRDRSSKDDLIAMGVNREIVITADPVLGIKAENIDAKLGKDILIRNGIKKEETDRLLGVFIRSWHDNEYLAELVKACDILTEHGWKIVFVPMHFPDDVVVAKQAAKEMEHNAHVLKELYSPEETLSVIKNLDLVLGMRLHALIDSAVVGVPFVGLSYDPKVDRFLEQMGQHSFVNIKNLKASLLVEMINWAQDRRDILMEDINIKAKALYQKAWHSARIAEKILKQVKTTKENIEEDNTPLESVDDRETCSSEKEIK